MIKDILVHLTGSAEDAVRLRYADSLAQACEAHLTGLFVHTLPSVLSITDPTGSAFLQELVETSNKEAEVVTERLTRQLAVLGTHAELRRLDAFPDAVGGAIADEVRTSDLFIGTRPYGDPAKSEYVEETVLFHSGRPCLFLPPKAALEARFGTIVVAWKNTREAARTIANALPLLQRATLVEVVMVTEDGGSFGTEAGADIGRYLSRHGVKADIRTGADRADTATTLLREAQSVRADMIVMGGYGHSRMREYILGGATRDVLRNATIPVFMAH